MRHLSLVTLILAASALVAQAPKAAPAQGKSKPAAHAVKNAQSVKGSQEAQAARQVFKDVLGAVDAGWFGKSYQPMTSVDIQGHLGITLSAAAVNAKIEQATQGQVKGAATKGSSANLQLQGTYFANGDFKTTMEGTFGHLVWTRVGHRGFIYSKEQNAYTTRVDAPPADAPLSFMAWFRQTLNEIQAVYADGPTFKASMGAESSVGGRTMQSVVFHAPVSNYDPKKREQAIGDTLGFWKRGRVELLFDKATKLPYRMDYSNDSQGVATRMEFSYGPNNRLQSVNVINRSKGMEGPGSLRVGYGANGLMSNVAGDLNSQNKKISFDLNLAWNSNKKSGSIASVPPPTATKKGGDELETMLMVGLAGQIMELQRNGLNFMAPKLVSK